MKKVLCILLAVVMTLALGACGNDNDSSSESPANTGSSTLASGGDTPLMNETGLPIVNEPYTLKLVSFHTQFQPENFDGIAQVDRFEEETGITLDFTTYPQSSWETQKALLFSSDDIPDMFVGNQAFTDADVLSYAKQGVIIPLQDLVEQYGVNLKKIFEEMPSYKSKVYDADGNMWSYPALADIDFGMRGNVTFVNKQWLSDAGYDVTYDEGRFIDVINEDFTTDEFTEMLQKFQQIHPGTSPWIPGLGSNAFLDYYCSFGSYQNSAFLKIKDNTIEFTATDPNLVDGIKWVAKLYQYGLIDPETFTMDSDTYKSKVKGDDGSAYGVVSAWTMYEFFEMSDPRFREWAELKPLIGPTGIQQWPKGVSSLINGFGVITTKAKHPEICARFIDYFYDEYNSIDLMSGPIGVRLEETEDGNYISLPAPDDVTDFNTWVGSVSVGCFPFITTPKTNEKVTYDDPAEMTIDVGMVVRPYQTSEYRNLPALNFTDEDNERIADISATMMDYIGRKHAEWISGSADIDTEWDEYCEELQKMGCNEYLEIYQNTYDSIKEYLK